jgi:hypothetical protein
MAGGTTRPPDLIRGWWRGPSQVLMKQRTERAVGILLRRSCDGGGARRRRGRGRPHALHYQSSPSPLMGEGARRADEGEATSAGLPYSFGLQGLSGPWLHGVYGFYS